VLPLAGAVLLAVVARNDDAFRLVVREDGPLEWAQVILYLALVVLVVRSLRDASWRGRRIETLVLVGLGLVAVVTIGEELSWAQRVIGFDTPELAARNRQGELTIHNDARIEHLMYVGLLGIGLYGLVTPLLVPTRSPLVPPRSLLACFGVAAAYYAFRLAFLERPSYVQAKFSEWPEACLALALLLWCADVAASATRDEAAERAVRPARPSPSSASSGSRG
jgi:hypothetical protein